ncbi:MAG: LysR family transcriptional regulator [Tabrizicola sp.]|nr:LysR family transcriptional regulator [Tabrizicola sp.]
MTRALSASLLTWLRCFDAAARHLSFQNAAAELAITPGAVSQNIRNLEVALGCVLFDRRHNSVVLSAAGVQLAPTVTVSYASLRQAIAKFDEKRANPKISISCSPSFALQWLTPRISRFVSTHPGVELSIFGEFASLPSEKMRLGGVNYAIRYEPVNDSGLAQTFLDEYLIAVASPEFLAATPEAADFSNIDGRHLLHDNFPWGNAGSDEEWRFWFRSIGRDVPDLSKGSRFNMSQMAIAAAMAGEGIAIGRLALVLNELIAGRLIPVFDLAVKSSAAYQLPLWLMKSAPKSFLIGWFGRVKSLSLSGEKY